jgi:hypothetical protein
MGSLAGLPNLRRDSSPQTHMTKHYHQTQHPVVTSAEAGERWLWCYPDEAFAEY